MRKETEEVYTITNRILTKGEVELFSSQKPDGRGHMKRTTHARRTPREKSVSYLALYIPEREINRCN